MNAESAPISMTPELARVLALARRRGACVRLASDAEISAARGSRGRAAGWHDAPFTGLRLSIDEIHRAVWLNTEDAHDRDAAGAVVHELGHLYATTDPVNDTNELRWFGWEIAVAREARVRKAWDVTMRDYQVVLDEYDHTWGELGGTERREVIRERLATAQAAGIVDASERALWLRCQQHARKGAKSRGIR